MSVQLLDRINRINRLLHNGTGYKIDTDELCNVFGELLHSNILISDAGGKVQGISNRDDIAVIDSLYVQAVGDHMPVEINERVISVLSPRENISLDMLGIEGDVDDRYEMFILPVDISGERLGTILTYRLNSPYDLDDIILGEYVTTIIALELLHDLYDGESAVAEKKRLVRTAVHSLSHSERYAAYCALTELEKSKGTLIVSRVAAEYDITRSAIVNSIKKLNSAGVIDSRSMGVKGTAIDIKNEYILDALYAHIPDDKRK